MKLKIDLPQFDGQLGIEEFLDWLKKFENYFEYAEITEEQRVKLVTYKLYGGASALWDQIQSNRVRIGKRPVQTWPRMRALLKNRYLPINYEQFLNCKQGNRSIHQYTNDFYRLQSQTNLGESQHYQVARYLSRLKTNIKEVVEMYTMNSLNDAVTLAYKAEKHRFSSPKNNPN